MSTTSTNLICPTCGNIIPFTELTLYHDPEQILRCNKCGYEFRKGPEGIENTVLDYLRAKRELQAVQYYRHATGANLKDSNDYMKDVAKRYGIELKKCFIATACYGYNSPEVELFRSFRDERLLKSSYGKFAVNIYYSASPFIANTIYSNKLLKNIVIKLLLKPLLKIINKT